jgi:hypothetical protein
MVAEPEISKPLISKPQILKPLQKFHQHNTFSVINLNSEAGELIHTTIKKNSCTKLCNTY